MSDNKSSSSGTSWFSVATMFIAFLISYALHKSVLWAILHFFFGLLYIMYAIVVYNVQIVPAIAKLFGVGV